LKLSLRFCLYLILGIASACSSNKDTFLNRKYQNIVARDNTYFNASEKLKNTVTDIAKSHKDNYLEILEVFPYADDNAGKAVTPTLEEVLKKSSRVINDYPISKWVDDSWMLIGKSHFFKRDFFASIETFQYISSRLKKSELRFEATVWTVKSLIQQKKLAEAEALLVTMKNSDAVIPEYMLGEYNATAAWLLIKQEKYSQAIEKLKPAIEHTRKKSQRIRYTFILAQLLQRDGKFPEARTAYKKVMKMNPSYEFAFNSRINLSRSYDFTDPATVREARAFLKKMTRDDKNKSFLDQIYFELGNLEMNAGNTDEAIEDYILSATNSVENPNQKAISFLKLADIYFNRPDYALAQAYFDSTVLFLKSDYPDYRKISDKKEVLSELISHIIVKDRETKLQKLAAMDSVTLSKAIDDMIDEDRKKAEKLAKEKEQQNALVGTPAPIAAPILPPSTQGASDWYFNNKQIVTMGVSDFSRKWGARKLEDNWRLSTKEKVIDPNSGGGGQDPNNPDVDPGQAENILDKVPEERKKYYADLPLTSQQKAISDSLLLESMFNIAGIYKEKIKDYKEAVKAYQDLLARFPENKYEARIYYQLYRLYTELNDAEKATNFKNLVLTKFPDSEFAAILDPKKPYQTIEEKDSKVLRYYEETYQAYTRGEYAEVQRRSFIADTTFRNNTLKPRFDFLNALAAAKTKGEEPFKTLLQEIVANYPNTEVAAEATNILNRLNTRNSEAQPEVTTELPPANFKVEPDAPHYYAFIFKKKDRNIGEIKAKFADYNKENHTLEQFEVSSMLFTDDSYLVLVKEFKNKSTAFNYYGRIRLNKEFWADMNIPEFDQFIVSADNFVELFKTKNVPSYVQFFQLTYPK
jgi:tetratricopeptide (TPR) repeat protein